MIYKLKDICLDKGFIRGPFGSALKKDLFISKCANAYKVYEQCVPLEQDKYKGHYYISKEYFESNLKRFEVKNNDFLISCSGVNYGAIYHLEEPFEKGVINQALLIIRVNPEIVDYNYFKYLFNIILKKAITSGTGDSTIPNFPSIELIKNIEIDIPNLNEQRKIGSILSSIDTQIQRNNDMVQKLQVLSQGIFNKFFINETDYISLLDFPYIQIIKSGIDMFKGNKYYIATAEVDNDKVNYNAPLIEYETRENRANMQPVKNSVWFAKMKNSIKHIYVSDVDSMFCSNYIFSTGFVGIKCEDNAFEYLIDFINTPYFEMKKDILSHGATMEGVNNEDLKSIQIPLPSKDRLIDFHNKVKELHYQITMLNEQTFKLNNLKEKLLPLLINQQLS